MTSGLRVGLEGRLREAIRSGQLAEGSRLPSSRTYAGELGVSRGTVTAAFNQLVAEGYLVAKPGAGTLVARVHRAESATPGASEQPVRLHDLQPGTPDVASFPVAAWLRAGRKALNAAAPRTFGYGDPRGQLELRQALADYLGRARGVVTTPEALVVTNSYAQSLSLLCTALGRGSVAMEDPGLPYHREIVRRRGLRVVPVPVDERGLVVDGLQADAVVTTAAHQYPTGVTLSPDRRVALVRWARGGRLVVEDDYDGEFRYDRQPIGALQGTAPDHVAYLGTTAKTLGPALRIGWMALPQHLLEPVTEAKRYADHHTDSLQQLTLAELIASHAYDRHIRAARLRYRRRRDLLLAGLAGLPVRVQGVSAGLQALVLLPTNGPSEAELLTLADAAGIALEGLAEHWHAPGAHPPGLVVGFGSSSERAYPAAVAALRGVLSQALAPRRT
ncbi:PLP-dependent aminotransferase family protein [Acidothermaceae bacterium B102]|nr:PLP-dependent aminotransferase family protein [Acidothermaceae bacterium B102]